MALTERVAAAVGHIAAEHIVVERWLVAVPHHGGIINGADYYGMLRTGNHHVHHAGAPHTKAGRVKDYC